MDIGLKAICLIVAVVCFALASLRIKAAVDFTNAGFAFVTASLVV